MKPHELAKTFDIVGIPLVDARANFIKPAKFGDVVEIASRVSRVPPLQFRGRASDLTINGELAVEGGETRVWAARDKANPDKFGATAIPAEVIARFGSSPGAEGNRSSHSR